MTTSLTSPADIINASLVQIGYPLRVGDLLDGSAAAQTALQVYSQTRDDMLRDGDWQFASRDIVLTLLKSAPVGGYVPGINDWNGTNYPPVRWQYEYAYPDDCLKVRAVKPVPIFIPNPDPRPYLFAIENDNYYTPARKVILTDAVNALAVYTGRVTNPATWDVTFTQALVDELAAKLTPALGKAESEQFKKAEAIASDNKAEASIG